jgi:cell division protein FtsB
MILGAGYFALFGGEYSVFELTRLRALEQDEAAELGRTEQRIDSLAALAAKLTGDSATIERVAREQYGMIRKGEILYRFHEPGREGDSSAVPAVGEDTAAGSGGTR